MARLIISREHDLEFNELCERAEQLADKLREKFGGSWRWEEDTLHYNYSGGVDAQVNPYEDEIEILVDMSMMMGMFKKQIEQEINRYLDDHLC